MGYQANAKTDNSVWGGKSANALYEEVQRMLDDGDKKEAIGGLRTLLVMHPDYALAHNDLGALYFKEGQTEKALEHYEEAVALEPENITFQKNLADVYCIEAGRLEDGLKIYLKLLEDNPTDMETLLTLGDICVSLKKNEDAKVFYERILELEPWNMDVQEKLDTMEKQEMREDGWQMTKDGGPRPEISGQESEAEKAAKLHISEVGGQPSGQESPSKIDLDGPSKEDAYERAQTLLEEDRQKEAIVELEQLIERCPDDALAHNDLGVMYFKEGEKQKALEHYERAIALDPDSITFQKNLADFYCLEAGRLEDGLRIYLKLLEDNPTDLETLMTLGDICVALEKGDDAKIFYERVLELEPWNMDASEKLDAL